MKIKILYGIVLIGGVFAISALVLSYMAIFAPNINAELVDNYSGVAFINSVVGFALVAFGLIFINSYDEDD